MQVYVCVYVCVCVCIRLYYVLQKQFFSLNVTYVDDNKKYQDIKFVCGFNRSDCFCLIVKCPQCLLYNLYKREKHISSLRSIEISRLFCRREIYGNLDILFSAK